MARIRISTLAVAALGLVGAAWGCGTDETRAAALPEDACDRQSDCDLLGEGYRCIAGRCEVAADAGSDAADAG